MSEALNVGVLLFLLIGNPRLPRVRRKKQQQLNDYIRRTSHGLDLGTLRPNPPVWFVQLVRLNRNLGAMPLSGENDAKAASRAASSRQKLRERSFSGLVRLWKRSTEMKPSMPSASGLILAAMSR